VKTVANKYKEKILSHAQNVMISKNTEIKLYNMTQFEKHPCLVVFRSCGELIRLRTGARKQTPTGNKLFEG